MSAGMTVAGSAAGRRRVPPVVALVLLAAGLVPLAALPQAALAAPAGASSISVGYGRSCLIASGDAYCWGSDADGTLGDGSNISSRVPVAVDTRGVLPGKTLTEVSTGDDSGTCALDSAGAAYCWGLEREGQLGDGNSGGVGGVPVAVDTAGVLAGKTLTQISVGDGQACALDSAGAAYCWGANLYGQSGIGYKDDGNGVPAAVDTSGALAGKTLTQISAGSGHTCALDSSGAAYCWGGGALGAGPGTPGAFAPVAVDTSGVLAGKTLTQISAGFDHTCALDSAGAAFCWGDNSDGQLGAGATGGYSYVPVAVNAGGALAGKTLSRISAGSGDTCALDTAGAAYCWGDNADGELGDGSTASSNVPAAVDASGALAGQTLTQIAADSADTCALDAAGAAYCWGSKGSLNLDYNDVPVGLRPQAPFGVTATSGYTTATVSWAAPAFLNTAALTGYTATAAPGGAACTTTTATTCTITGLAGGTAYNVTVVAHTTGGASGTSLPAGVMPRGVGAISAGSDSCSVETGRGWCWGSNDDGQLGDGSTGDSPVPVAAVQASGVLAGQILTQIATSDDDFTCALDAAGAAFCWGLNTFGQLGDGSTGKSTRAGGRRHQRRAGRQDPHPDHRRQRAHLRSGSRRGRLLLGPQ